MKRRLIQKSLVYSLIFAGLTFISCSEETEKNNKVEEHISKVRSEYAPDKRIAMFDINVEQKGNMYLLTGETNIPEAKNDLISQLESRKIDYKDSIKVLPDPALENMIYGVITNSVANLRGEGKHSAELVTQATLGTPVKVWKKENTWYLIQTPDGYLAWVDAGGIQLMDKKDFESWKSSSKIIYKKTYGQSYSENKESARPVSDLVAGSVLELLEEKPEYFKVKYPDKREAYILRDESEKLSDWLANLSPTENSLVSTADNLMGLPYLWGGTSSKGVDCSGFTKTVYFMNGMILPRDASQQIREGKLIDSVGQFEKLAIGDLLFFGRKATDSTKEKVVHVGMWIGNNEFIHASGDVHISSMDSTSSNFDDFNKNRYLRTKRILGESTKGLSYLKKENIYMTEKNKDSLLKK